MGTAVWHVPILLLFKTRHLPDKYAYVIYQAPFVIRHLSFVITYSTTTFLTSLFPFASITSSK